MNNIFMIVKNNMKKQKGDMITFLIMTIVASFLIFNSVTVFMGISRIFDNRFDEVNGPDFFLFVADDEETARCADEALRKNGIDTYEATSVLYANCEYKNKDADEFSNFQFFFEKYTNDNKILDVIPDDVKLADDEVMVPYTMKAMFAEGDTLVIRLGEKTFDLKVKGYSENPLFCTTNAASLYYVYIAPSMYEKMEVEAGNNYLTSPINRYSFYKGKVDFEVKDYNSLLQKITDDYSELIEDYQAEHPETDYSIVLSAYWQLLRMADMIVPVTMGSVIFSFAILMLVISLVITSFSVNNFIQRNMKNIGIMEACGYTVKELRKALTVQLMSIEILGTISGIILGAVSVSFMSDAFTSIAGLTWNNAVNPAIAVITALIILLPVYIAVRIMSRKFIGITVLDALRGGISSHNFKKNHFSFEKTALPIPIVLSLKDTFGSVKKNIAMVLIMAILTFSVVFAMASSENMTSSDGGLIQSMGFDYGDIMVSTEAGLGDDFRKLDGVEKVCVSQTTQLTAEHDGTSYTYNTYAMEDCEQALNMVMIEGRVPVSDNEIMITWVVADELKAEVGDVVTIRKGSRAEDFIVTGINQKIEMMGKSMTVTLTGFDRLGARQGADMYSMLLKEGTTYEDIRERVNDFAKEKGIEVSITNPNDLVGGTLATINSTFAMVGVIIVILTVLVVIFVESLVVRAKITREWKGMGISKALGLTSGDLISQIALSNIPAIIMGCLIGGLFTRLAGGALVGMMTAFAGVKKLEFSIGFKYIILASLGIILVAILTSAIAGLKVKKLIPIEMITEE